MASSSVTQEQWSTLTSMAVAAKSHSYSPYSKYRVGAAVLLSDGSIVTGCNVENAGYSSTICAERTAFCKAISEGRHGFIACVVSTDIGSDAAFTYPCGVCRQFMIEFCPDLLVASTRGDDASPEMSSPMPLRSLLPHFFGPDALPHVGPAADAASST